MTNTTPNQVPTSRSSLPMKILKIFGWIAGCLIALLILIMCAVAWILTPERLTPIVEKYASEYLNADVKVGRIELTVWKSFPYVALDVQELHLVSRSLQGQPDSVMKVLPADASRLLDAGSIHASINPWHMLHGVIQLGDINIKGLGINLVAYSPTVTNYDIVPPSEPSEESSAWEIRLADISIAAPGGIRYFDAAAGIDAMLARPQLTVNASGDNLKLDFNTFANLAMTGNAVLKNMPLTLGGNILFKQNPMAISSQDFQLTAWGLPLNFKFGVDLGNSPALTQASLTVPPLKIMPLLEMLAPEMLGDIPELKLIDSDISLGLQADVQTPWKFDSPTLPSVEVKYEIPTCRLAYGKAGDKNRLEISELNLSGSFTYDGAKPEASAAHIPVFTAKGEGIDLSLTADITEALSDDPLIALSSKGRTELAHFRSLIPIPGATLSGSVDADASLRCRLSDITEMRFTGIDADGRVEVRNLLFSIPVMATKFYASLATVTFGNDMETRDYGNGLVKGLLRARADIDTVYMAVPGIEVGMRDFDLHAGTTPQLLSMSDNNKDIIPMGMKLTVGRVVADSEVDTLHVNARALTADGSITRYQGNSRSPLLKAGLSAERVRYTDPLTRLGIRGFDADISANLRARKTPTGKRSSNRQATTATDANNLDLSVQDEGLKALLRKWGVQGGVKADRVNLTYILYPVRTRLTNLALDFSLDSLRLHRAYITSQDNRLSLAGTISGMRSALLGRNRKPLTIRLEADIDSLDLNQIAYNYNLGLGLQAKRGMLAKINPEDEDALVRAAAEQEAPAEEKVDTTPFIVPRNVDAQVKLFSKYALYTNLAFYDLRGNLIINDGALSVDSLTMSTDFGNAYLNLLYSSRDIQDLNMAVDLGFNRVNLENFYTSFPQVTEMMPIITNLHGMVGASLTGSFNLFPTMDIDLGSLNAMLNITGADLTVTQDPIIRKIARMMLIRKKGDLNISDMNIQVSVHDNVMRLYPFSFSMEKYKFALLGENDMDQNMYYHLSVLNSPVPWKFGINIKGTFDNPKFRFGGAKYKENEAREVVNLVQSERVNFVRAMRLQLHKLVNRAALNYADRREPDNSAERLNQSGGSEQYDDPTQVISHAVADPIARVLGKNADLLRSAQEKAAKDKKKKKK